MNKAKISRIMNYANLTSAVVNTGLGTYNVLHIHPGLGVFQFGCAAVALFVFWRIRKQEKQS